MIQKYIVVKTIEYAFPSMLLFDIAITYVKFNYKGLQNN